MAESSTSSPHPPTISTEAKRIKTHHEGEPPTTTIHEVLPVVPSTEVINDDDLLRYIFSFTGDYQYLYIGSVNRSFRKSYAALYPEKHSSMDVSTTECALFVWNDIEAGRSHQTITRSRSKSTGNDLRVALWEEASINGTIEILQKIHELLTSDTSFEMDYAICEYMGKDNGCTSIMKWILHTVKNDIYDNEWKMDICRHAVAYGHMDLLQWAFQLPDICNDDDDDVVDNDDEEDDEEEDDDEEEEECNKEDDDDDKEDDDVRKKWWITFEIAAVHGNVECLKFLRENIDADSSYFHDTFVVLVDVAVAYNRLEAVEYLLTCLRKNTAAISVSNDACAVAACHGNLTLLQLLRSYGYDWDKRVPDLAAACGHLNIVEWAHTNGCPWSEMACMLAAGYGHFDVLQWLHEHDCPWNTHTTTFALTEEIYDWAVINGCTVAIGNPRVELPEFDVGKFISFDWTYDRGKFGPECVAGRTLE